MNETPIVRAPRLLDREAEMRQLELAIERAAAGQSTLLVVEGTPGIGKTALLGQLERLAAEAGFQTLTARGTIIERRPGASSGNHFEAVLGGTAGERVELLRGAAGLARRVLGMTDEPGEEVDFAGALHGLHWLTRNLAERRHLLLLIDDVQWPTRSRCPTSTT